MDGPMECDKPLCHLQGGRTRARGREQLESSSSLLARKKVAWVSIRNRLRFTGAFHSSRDDDAYTFTPGWYQRRMSRSGKPRILDLDPTIDSRLPVAKTLV